MHSVSSFAILLAMSAATASGSELENQPASPEAAIKQDAPELIVAAVEEGSAEYLTAQDHIQDVMPHPVTVLRSRLVLIDSSWLDRAVVPAEISIQLFEDTVCHAKHKGVKDFSSGSWVWIGSCELRGETPVRLHKSPQGYIRGTIQVGGTKYVIDRVAKNIYVIYHVNPAKYYQVD